MSSKSKKCKSLQKNMILIQNQVLNIVQIVVVFVKNQIKIMNVIEMIEMINVKKVLLV